MERLIQSASFGDKTDGLNEHAHDCYEMIFVSKGRLSVTVAGKRYTAQAPCVIFVSRLETHSVTVLSEEYERIYLCISPLTASEYIRSYTLLSVLSARSPMFRHVLELDGIEAQVRSITEKIISEFENPQEYSDELQAALLMQLFILIRRQSPEMFTVENERSAGVIFRIQCRLEEECSQPFSLDGLAREYNMSRSHLSHLFKRVTGYPIMQYLLFCRLAAARRLLRDTDKSVVQIAELTGFSDQSNFSRYFKRENGCTPLEYRFDKSK